MKYLLLLLISSQCFAEYFYYTKTGWAGPYDPAKLPNIGATCKALIDPSTKLPYDLRLIECGKGGFAKMKAGSALAAAKAELDFDKAKEQAIKDLDFCKDIRSSLKALEKASTPEAYFLDQNIALIQRYLDNGNVQRARNKMIATDFNAYGMNVKAVVDKMNTYLKK